MKAVLVALLLVALHCICAIAGTPSLVNYQGYLTDPGGSPVADGSYSVVFTIYDSPSGGTSKWTETQSITTSGGLFTVLLGTITPVIDTVFNNSSRYLGIKVASDPEITPRTQLVSTPYSYRISTVDGSTGGSISGNIFLDNSTTTTGNISKGGNRFIHNYGTDNTFVGRNAGNLAMTGSQNTGTGTFVLTNNTSGGANTACGAEVLLSNTSGFGNTAIGRSALRTNNGGNYNTACGYTALFNNADGLYNTACGSEALYFNTSGGTNTANGVSALRNNTTGFGNTGIGANALLGNTTGDSCVAVGLSALNNNSTGDYNTATGADALRSNTTGFNNTGVGYLSLRSNTTGAYNTAIGVNTMRFNGIGTNNTAGGWSALENNFSGNNNVAIGAQSIGSNSTGSENTACGVGALTANTTGSSNTAIGFGANVASGSFTNATAIGANALVDASNKIRLGDGSVSVICGAVGFTVCSDRNLKENFQTLDQNEILKKIRRIPVTSWNYRSNDPTKFRHYGPMAQDFFAAFGHDAVGQSGDSVTINSSDLSGVLMVAIQSLAEKTESLENQIAEITKVKTENAALIARLDLLEAALNKLATLNANSEGKQLSKK